MENSLTLGLLHGLVYGIVPVAPWFVALKRYLLEGKEKGQLAVAGTIAGQVTLLTLTFFGWSQVLWVWYYFEPALIILGTLAVLRCALDCWVEQPSSLQTTPVPLVDKKEGFYYFLVNFGLMFCNPGHLEGSQTLLSSIPGNRYFYLIAFTIAYTSVIFIFWATIGHRIFGKAYSGFGAQQTLNRYRIRRVAVAMTAAVFVQFLNCTPEALVIYHFDSLLAYTPFEQLKHHRTRGYVWLDSGTGEGIEKRQSAKSTNKSGIMYEQWPSSQIQNQPMWNTESRYEECNQTRERELPNVDYNEELTFHEFRGINQATNKARLIPFHLYMLPKWEQQESKDFLLTLRKIRTEMDDKLISEGSLREQRLFLPHSGNWESEVDYITNPTAMEKALQEQDQTGVPSSGQVGLQEMREFVRGRKWSFNDLNLGNGKYVEASYAKLHKLPAEARLPWHYPFIKTAPEMMGENLSPSEQLEKRNEQFQANVEFLANDPADFYQPDVFKRIWEARNLDKVTPRPNSEAFKRRVEAQKALQTSLYAPAVSERVSK
jgi:hypothetical protein